MMPEWIAMFPGWIDVRSYDSRFDNFYYSNWVAVAQPEPLASRRF